MSTEKKLPVGTSQEWFDELVDAVPGWLLLRGSVHRDPKPTTQAFQIAEKRMLAAAANCAIALTLENMGGNRRQRDITVEDRVNDFFDRDTTPSHWASSQLSTVRIEFYRRAQRRAMQMKIDRRS